VKFASVQTLEKIPRAIELTPTGSQVTHRCRSSPTPSCNLSAAVAAVGRWQAPVRLNETTKAYFERLAAISQPEDAARYSRHRGRWDRGRRGRPVLPGARRAACFDASHVDFADDHSGGYRIKRHSFGGHGDARRADAPRRRPADLPRGGS